MGKTKHSQIEKGSQYEESVKPRLEALILYFLSSPIHPLGIFKSNIHNKNISSKLEAWLAFLCMDEPEWIIRVIETYPEFEAMYRQIYEMCLNVERMMEMFSKELQELDRNTVHYMIDEMQNF